MRAKENLTAGKLIAFRLDRTELNRTKKLS